MRLSMLISPSAIVTDCGEGATSMRPTTAPETTTTTPSSSLSEFRGCSWPLFPSASAPLRFSLTECESWQRPRKEEGRKEGAISFLLLLLFFFTSLHFTSVVQFGSVEFVLSALQLVPLFCETSMHFDVRSDSSYVLRRGEARLL